MRKCAFIIMLLSAALILFVAVNVFIQPLSEVSLTVLNSPLKPGDPIQYETVWTRRIECKLDLQRDVVKLNAVDGVEEIYHRDRIPGAPIGVEGKELYKNVSYLQPARELTPGNYLLRQFVLSSCSLLAHVSKYPDAPFEVVNR